MPHFSINPVRHVFLHVNVVSTTSSRAAAGGPMKTVVDAFSNPVSLQGRPMVIDARRPSGDWEGTAIVGGRDSGAVVTRVERKGTAIVGGRHLGADVTRVERKGGYLLSAKSCASQSAACGR